MMGMVSIVTGIIKLTEFWHNNKIISFWKGMISEGIIKLLVSWQRINYEWISDRDLFCLYGILTYLFYHISIYCNYALQHVQGDKIEELNWIEIPRVLMGNVAKLMVVYRW